jgi:biotin transport system ATP-binding protein
VDQPHEPILAERAMRRGREPLLGKKDAPGITIGETNRHIPRIGFYSHISNTIRAARRSGNAALLLPIDLPYRASTKLARIQGLDIRLTDCSVRFGERVALQPLTLALDERRIGIIGLNGSGKTTFARLINGLVKPTTGRVTVNGLDTLKDDRAVLAEAGFIFQNPQHQLIMPIVSEDIAFGLKNRGLPAHEITARTEAVLARFGVSHLAKRRVHELSGGETQLVAMASVVVTGPKILILDEPTNQLDLRNRRMVTETIDALNEDTIVITHDLGLVEGVERLLLFHEGRLVADGSPDETIRRYHEVARC